MESNITPWRRAVVGDLTTAFDFNTPNRLQPVTLPGTDDFKPTDLVRHPDEVPVPPANQQLPPHEHGVRPARTIPYTAHADGHAAAGVFTIDFRSVGQAAVVFQARSADIAQPPRTYTVEPGKHLTDTWELVSGCDVSVHGPNGFFRGFKAGNPGTGQANLDVTASYDDQNRKIVLEITNRGSEQTTVIVHDGYTGQDTKLALGPGEAQTKHWSLSRTRGWYDLLITVQDDPSLEYRYAGHLENGQDSITDPAMGGLLSGQ